MNRIRVLVQVIVMVGILTGCDSCDDGMDYPIVEYEQGGIIDTWKQDPGNQGRVEQVRLALKAHPDIKFLEMVNGMIFGRVGDNRVKLGIGNLSTPLTNSDLQILVAAITTAHLTQLFGVPAGPLATADSTAATADSTAATADDPAA